MARRGAMMHMFHSFFVGNGIRPKTLYRKVETIDLAPTVSAWLGISPPSGAMGNVLTEVAEQKD